MRKTAFLLARLLLTLLAASPGTHGFSGQQQHHQCSQRATALQGQSRTDEASEKHRFPCHPCDDDPQTQQSPLDDRREALFALLGTLWATTTTPAYASYGDDAKIALPNPLQGLTDRTTRQCLVESLGNRECLVYADESSNALFEGYDGQVLLERIDQSSVALAKLPELIASKKWSQVTGVLTGPMGDLIRTMGQLAELSPNKAQAKTKVQQVKKDLYSISDAVGRKDVDQALRFHQAATSSLVAFVKSL